MLYIWVFAVVIKVRTSIIQLCNMNHLVLVMIMSIMSRKSLMRLKLIMLMVCLVWVQVVCGEHEIQCIQREREALLQFKASLYDSFGMTSSWTTPDCCQWKGIRCSNLTRHIIMLDLHADFHVEYAFNYYEISSSGSYLSGEIHESLMELQQLNYLNFSFNSFGNTHIPEFLGSLTSLISLDLSSCGFRGKIPTHIGSLSHLKYLNLAGNSLEGSLFPLQLGNLSQLQHLDLNSNYFEGKIPSQLGNLSKLQYLDLRYNSFEGNIPSQLGNLSNLQELYLGGYYYGDGPLKIDDGAPWLSNLISLTHLYLWSIPNLNTSHSYLQMIAKLPKLRQLSLRDCSLSDHFIFSLRSSTFNFSTSLFLLDLSLNTFTSPMIFQWVSNITSNLVELDLSENLLEVSTSNHFGMVKMNLLEHLHLSYNRLKGEVLKSFMNICTLHSLYMNGNNLTEDLSSILHNLFDGCVRHSLQELDLSFNQIIGSLPDFSVFSSLKILDLSTNQLSGKIPEDNELSSQMESLFISSNSLEGGVPKSFGRACTLGSLDLSNNSLSEELSVIFDHLSGCSRYSLQALNLEINRINGTLPDLSILSSLKILILSENHLSGKIPENNILSYQLKFLSISSNSLEGGLPKSFGNACALYSLDMSNNSLGEEFTKIIHHLSGCARYSLKYLYLSMNQINGTLPDLSIFSSLKILYLGGNKLNGDIPKDIGFPPRLESLDMRSNSLKGVFTDYHFTNVSMLNFLDLSENSLLTLKFTQNWVPPFQLSYIRLRSCMLGPTFPKWLKTQNDLNDLDISNAGISDLVPMWFWDKIALQKWISMNISYNNLFGIIPNFPLKNPFYSLILGSNRFVGSIPPFLRYSMFLDLSKNKFSNSFSFLCANGTDEILYQLDLSNNELFEQIPDCWSHFKSLSYLDLSHNNFSGKIPTSMGSLFDLQALLLRNNNLTNEIPFSLRNCKKLVMLDMAKNKLSGLIPAWIGRKLQELQILSLGMNHFNGSLPPEICYLRSIQLLDLSLNNLSGKIPRCIKNFTSMAQNAYSSYYAYHWYFVNISYTSFKRTYDLNAFLMWKGSEQMFKNTGLSLLKSIDLSSNHFSEEIPIEIENLFELISLNLSNNHLIGKIPSNIGKLKSLEFLDLSRNQLAGSIPISLVQIDRLSVLNLSNNHLCGKIPTGTQLQSFDASSYEDNPDLCGPPLEKLCINEEPKQRPVVKLHEDGLFFTREFYMSMTIGFVISFWGVFGSILIKRSWRHAYFKFLSNVKDTIYVMVAVKVLKWRHRI
ncbi:receptor-like protein EIX2 [Cajanus cajan]|uniref:receptor-like protein EIX2 n=1 Tax=Cajanus cajan TaxID=3821 RepID=UPI0010FB4CB0|nr:receptor-like protein EIX2 [Cajanus cajan]